MSIPKYPDFRPLELEDISLFNQAFKNNPPVISEFTFTNLYAWREIYKLQLAILEDLIVVRSQSQHQQRFFDPIGKPDSKAVIERILKDSSGIFIRLPQTTRSLFGKDRRFEIELDIDNSDYLYRTADLVALEGKKYDGKRNLIKNFKSRHNYEYIKLQAENAKECLDF